MREQDFGNFQPCSAEMERMWQERADYGHFFYRIPNGESAADAYDRISGFNESLWRQFGEDDFASVCVLVTHGLMSRVFLTKWYHFTVEYFEDLRNVNHCEFLIMRKQENGKYLLENQLRTWSELRHERALKEAREAKDTKDDPGATPSKLERSKTYVSTRRWGGCPNGCDHSSHYVKKREDLEVLRQKDHEHAAAAATTTMTTTTIASRRQRHVHAASSDQGVQEEEDQDGSPSAAPRIGIIRTTTGSVEEPLSSPEGGQDIPSPFSIDDERREFSLSTTTTRFSHLHVGRDGGGTYSGHASTVGSDTEVSEDEHHRHHPRHRRVESLDAQIRIANAESLQAQLEREAAADKVSQNDNGLERCEFANRLGDVPPEGEEDSDSDPEPEDLDKAEKEDRSIRGSVY